MTLPVLSLHNNSVISARYFYNTPIKTGGRQYTPFFSSCRVQSWQHDNSKVSAKGEEASPRDDATPEGMMTPKALPGS